MLVSMMGMIALMVISNGCVSNELKARQLSGKVSLGKTNYSEANHDLQLTDHYTGSTSGFREDVGLCKG
jgi:hypothetical protein